MTNQFPHNPIDSQPSVRYFHFGNSWLPNPFVRSHFKLLYPLSGILFFPEQPDPTAVWSDPPSQFLVNAVRGDFGPPYPPSVIDRRDRTEYFVSSRFFLQARPGLFITQFQWKCPFDRQLFLSLLWVYPPSPVFLHS